MIIMCYYHYAVYILCPIACPTPYETRPLKYKNRSVEKSSDGTEISATPRPVGTRSPEHQCCSADD